MEQSKETGSKTFLSDADRNSGFTLDEYQTLAGRTEKRLSDRDRLAHLALGIANDAGEVAGAIRNHVIYGKPLDGANVREELGDLLWFISRLADAIETSLSEVAASNLAKLRRRYPEKYTDELAAARLDKRS
jgi:NTP pyrophosphatase (non-canonical NTP hydrolase)